MPADLARVRTRGVVGRLTSAPWHPLLFATVVVLSAWFDATISPYPLARPLLVAVLGATALTVVAALVLRSAPVGGFVATAAIWVLWSRNLLDLAETAIQRLGVAGIAFAVAIVIVVILVARILRRGIARWTVEGATSVLNRVALLLLLVTVLMGVATGRVGRAIADLDQGQDLETWLASPGTDGGRQGPDVYAILLDGYPRADVPPMLSTSTTGRSSARLRSVGSRSPGRAIRITSGPTPRCLRCCTWTMSSTSRSSNRSPPVARRSSRRFAR